MSFINKKQTKENKKKNIIVLFLIIFIIYCIFGFIRVIFEYKELSSISNSLISQIEKDDALYTDENFDKNIKSLTQINDILHKGKYSFSETKKDNVLKNIFVEKEIINNKHSYSFILQTKAKFIFNIYIPLEKEEKTKLLNNEIKKEDMNNNEKDKLKKNYDEKSEETNDDLNRKKENTISIENNIKTEDKSAYFPFINPENKNEENNDIKENNKDIINNDKKTDNEKDNEKDQIKEYKVNIILNGGYLKNTSYLLKENIVLTKEKLGVPVKEGYTFIGWYLDENFKKPFTQQIIKNNINIYAKYTPNKYSIILNNIEPLTNKNITLNNVYYDSFVSLKKYIDKNSIYHFDGWYFDKELTNKVNNNLQFNFNKDINLYAKWTKENILIKRYESKENGIYLNELEPLKIPINSKLTQEHLNSISKEGFIFKGWLHEDSVINKNTTFTEDTVIYASWEKNKYNLEFNYNLDNNNFSENKIFFHNDCLGNLPNPSQVGYDFIGWYTDETNGSKVNNQTKITENTILWAHWNKKTKFINFNTNIDSSLEKMKIKYGDKIELPTISKMGYIFDYWSLNETKLEEKDIWKNDDDITLDAHFSPITYTISYDLNGGNLENKINEYTIESDNILLSHPIKEGYEFIGWITEENTNPEKEINITTGSFGNKHFIAKYEEINFLNKNFYKSIPSYNSIESINFINNIPNNIDEIEYFDISEKQNTSIIAWKDKSNNNILYIASNTNIYAPIDSSYLFNNFTNANEINNLNLLDVSQVEDMSYLFGSRLKKVDLSSWDFSKVKKITRFLGGANSKFETIILGDVNTSSLTDSSYMFAEINLNLIEIDSIDISNVKNAKGMFYFARGEFDFSLLNTSKLENAAHMFEGYYAENLDMSVLDMSNVTNMSSMFDSAKINNLNLEMNSNNVIDMSYMFARWKANNLNLTGINTSNVTNMKGMFYNNSTLKTIDISPLDTHNVTNMSEMFASLFVLETLELSTLDTSNVTDMSMMFNSCTSLKILDLSSLNTSKVTTMASMFSYVKLESLNINSFDTKNVVSMSSMFSNMPNLKSLDISNWDTSNVENMSYMFYKCKNLSELKFDYDTNKEINKNNMFTGATSLKF